MIPSTQNSPPDSRPKEQGYYLTDFQRKLLTQNLTAEVSLQYQQRLKIMLLADEGYSQSQICHLLNCSHATARFWIGVAQAGQAHEWNKYQLGRPKAVDQHCRNVLKELVSQSPRNYGYPFQRWTAHWLSKHLAKITEIHVSDRHVSRLLRDMGLSTRSTQPSKKGSSRQVDAPLSKIVIRDL